MSEQSLNDLDLELLRTLTALIEEQQVSRAAAKLGITQPTMSRRLKRLREIFDDPLLVPGRRGRRLTPRAESMRDPLRAVLEAFAAMLDPHPRGDERALKIPSCGEDG